MSSARFEDLKDELSSIEDKIRLQLKHNINEVTLNKLCSEGDAIVNLMKREVDLTPALVNHEMSENLLKVSKEWNTFKSSSRNVWQQSINSGPTQTLSRGISILERTNESLMRAEAVARESETIGTETIAELGQQRESLVRTREQIDGTNYDLKKTHRLLRSINRRVLTNKCLLIFIIVIEIFILFLIVYLRFIKH